MANLKTEALLSFFTQSPEFHILHTPSHETAAYCSLDFGYLDLIRPKQIQVVADLESEYINSLAETEQHYLLQRLATSNVTTYIFCENCTIPDAFTRQDNAHIIQSTLRNLTQIKNAIFTGNIANKNESICMHGSFVVVYNQGLLITGKTGTGKSTLLLKLLELGHMWVADDAPLFFQTKNKEIIGYSAQPLDSYVHIKDVGIIDMDNEYGRTKQLKQYKLSGIIRLIRPTEDNNKTNTLDPRTSECVLGEALPAWTLNSNNNDLALIVEKCAHQILLQDWGISDAKNFNRKLNQLLK